MFGSRCSSVVIEIGLWARSRIRGFRVGVRDFRLLHSIETGSGAHTGTYRMGTGYISWGRSGLGREADYRLRTSAEVKNAIRYTYTP